MASCHGRLLFDKILMQILKRGGQRNHTNLNLYRANCCELIQNHQFQWHRSYSDKNPPKDSTNVNDARMEVADPMDINSVSSVQHQESASAEDASMKDASMNDASMKDESMKDASMPGKESPPDLPGNCCMSGCPNCVWVEYAQELSEYYKDGGAQAKEAIKRIPDANLRAFLQMELKFR